MKLYHFSNADIKFILDINRFGENLYSKDSLKQSQIKRLYFYDTLEPQESYTKSCRYRYMIRIPEKSLYHVKEPITPEHLEHAKSLGYAGLCTNKYSRWQGCVLFYDTVIYKKVDLYAEKFNIK